DMVVSGLPARGQQHHQEQCGGGKADDDRGQHQRLRQRIGVLDDVAGGIAQHRVGAGAQPAGGEDEQIDRVGNQGQADDHLEGARAQQQPGAGAGEHADGQGEDQFHQCLASTRKLPSAATTAVRGRRSDWCASATSINVVAPTTRQNTPRSNSTAVASGSFPSNGSSAYWKCEVRNGWPKSSEPRPVPAASSRPIAIQRTGRTRSRASTQRAPRAMYIRISATETVMPAAKPPPGRSCPRRNRCTPNSSTTGNISCTITAGIAR